MGFRVRGLVGRLLRGITRGSRQVIEVVSLLTKTP